MADQSIMIVFVLPEKGGYRKLYRRWFDSSIDVLTDRNDLETQTKISSTHVCGRWKTIRQAKQ